MKTKERGRPARIDWTKFLNAWRSKTNAEIACEAGCTVVNVFLKRKGLVTQAKLRGKKGDFYLYKKGKAPYTRSRYLTKA